MPLDAPNLTYLWTQLLVEELVRCGVRLFVVAPGSRSTPLAVAVARHPGAQHVVHFDERGGAFAALGYGRATGRPAAWITTSGTAVANGWPAVVEASVDGVPLLLLTADRPPELADTQANQTVDQVKIFGAYVRWQADLPVPASDVDPAYVLTTASQAVHRAVRSPSGPVHLNCRFRKPLEPATEAFDEALVAPLRVWASSGRPYTRYDATAEASSAALAPVADRIQSAARGLVVAGSLRTPDEAAAVRALAVHLGWPLLPDVRSQLRVGPAGKAVRVAHADQVLAGEAAGDALRPDVVLHLGGRFVSQRWEHFFVACAPAARVVVDERPVRLDPTHCVTHRVQAGVETFCRRLMSGEGAPPDSGWRAAWRAAETAASEAVEAVLAEEERLSEPAVARQVSRLLPDGHGWMLASSMPVRDANRYAAPADAAPALVTANRGASGIDGTVATAAGLARGLGRPVTLTIGDLALLHDLNSLALLRTAPVVAVVLNNDGGGIFHFLPIAEHADVFESHFGTPHGRTFEHAAALFDLPYRRPETPPAFADAYRAAVRSGRSALIEVTTDRVANRALHDRLEARAVARVAEALRS